MQRFRCVSLFMLLRFTVILLHHNLSCTLTLIFALIFLKFAIVGYFYRVDFICVIFLGELAFGIQWYIWLMGLVDWRLDSQGWSVGWRFVEQWNFRRLLCSSGFDIRRWSFPPSMGHLFRLSQRFCSGRCCFVDFRRFVPYLVGQLSRLALIEIQWIPLYRMAQLLLQIVDLVINHIKGIRLK